MFFLATGVVDALLYQDFDALRHMGEADLLVLSSVFSHRPSGAALPKLC